MTLIQAIILGVIQGFTELLPISSSAHLNLIPWMLNWNIPESFDVALHLGTLLSIGIYFFKDWLNLIKGGINYALKKQKSSDGKLFWYIIFATIPGGIIGFLLDHTLGEKLENMPVLIGIMLILMGIVLYIADKNSKAEIDFENIDFLKALTIGLSQAIAFIPGVSRSGITMTTGRLMGITREGAARYSFMLSAPIVLAASIYKFKDFVFSVPFIAGVFVSALIGLIVIKFLLNYLKNSNFKLFAIYRIIIGLATIILYIVRT